MTETSYNALQVDLNHRIGGRAPLLAVLAGPHFCADFSAAFRRNRRMKIEAGSLNSQIKVKKPEWRFICGSCHVVVVGRKAGVKSPYRLKDILPYGQTSPEILRLQ